ncbi:subtilase-type protease inhibitor [Streptomyces sp. RerS4]|uniref:subtilase-type protease inhibitor n=1 Tax=Streptomyces sp. RerS4 TaxID=2942449 RepID=UPI00201C7E4A|nr:subtilase-type protease inhibitor [Streptomyces sp. RerS4]UQX04494.1 subtilase-type protease inhibitor [Streptomyces sp. RerS4]
MRHRLATVSAAALLCLAGATGAAQAEPASLYAPSAMVFTITDGDDPATGTVLRATVLSCAYTATGTHPAPRAACDALNATDGEFNRLLAAPNPDRACPMHYDPVTVTADGVWRGSHVEWKHTFSNACAMSATLNGNPVYAF